MRRNKDNDDHGDRPYVQNLPPPTSVGWSRSENSCSSYLLRLAMSLHSCPAHRRTFIPSRNIQKMSSQTQQFQVTLTSAKPNPFARPGAPRQMIGSISSMNDPLNKGSYKTLLKYKRRMVVGHNEYYINMEKHLELAVGAPILLSLKENKGYTNISTRFITLYSCLQPVYEGVANQSRDLERESMRTHFHFPPFISLLYSPETRGCARPSLCSSSSIRSSEG